MLVDDPATKVVTCTLHAMHLKNTVASCMTTCILVYIMAINNLQQYDIDPDMHAI